MACDGRRRDLFIHTPRAVDHIIGASGPARAYLETLFDVARQQPVPQDKAEQLAAAAATQKMKAWAQKKNIDLFPHPSKTGLPKLDVQMGWKAVADALDALARGTPLPPLAAELQQSSAFACLTHTPRMQSLWEAPLMVPTRQNLRWQWAADPERLRLLLAQPEGLGEEVHTPWLRHVTELVAADTKAPLAISGAARHYLALDDEAMLGPEERARWAQVLAALAGVGIHPRGINNRNICEQCGAWDSSSTHRCFPEVAALTPELVRAVAAALADPDAAGEISDPSPVSEADRLLDANQRRTRRDPAPDSPVGRVLTAMRQVDRAWVTALGSVKPSRKGELTLTPEEERRLRDATIRSPVMFLGRPCIWDRGGLFDVSTYGDLCRWQLRRSGGETVTADEVAAFAVGQLPGARLAAMMAGNSTMGPGAITVNPVDFPDEFKHYLVPVAIVGHNHYLAESCGCIYRCDSITDTELVFHRAKASGSCGCGTTRRYDKRRGGGIPCINHERPLYALPTWPDTTTGGA